MNLATCDRPELGEALLEAARSGGGALGFEHGEHLRGCGACRLAVERLRRMNEAWRASGPTTAEIFAARGRFLAPRPSKRAPHRLSGALAVALILGAGAAFGGVRMWRDRTALPLVSQKEAPVERGQTARPPARRSPSGSPSPSAELAPSPDLTEAGTPVVRTPVDRIGSAPSPESVHAPSTVVSSVASPSAKAASGWEAAAAALRRHDYAEADRRLTELAASNEPRTRDEARLARAQIWLGQGRTDRARPEFAQLAATGATALVRSRATEALRQLGEDSTGGSSPGTNTP